jgi:hypothetical protein
LNAAKQQLNAPQAQFERPEGIHPLGAIERSRRLLPTSWNRYLYCRNDPINMIDPDGEFGILAMLAAAAATVIFAEVCNAPETEADIVPAQGPIVTVLGPAAVGAAVEQLGVRGTISAAEPLLPDDAWNKNAPHQVTLGTKLWNIKSLILILASLKILQLSMMNTEGKYLEKIEPIMGIQMIILTHMSILMNMDLDMDLKARKRFRIWLKMMKLKLTKRENFRGY